MRILEKDQALMKALQDNQFDLEEFFPHIQHTSVTSFYSLTLENRHEILLLDVESMKGRPVDDSLLALLNTHLAVIAFIPDKSHVESHKWLQNLLAVNDRIVFVQELPLKEPNATVLKNLLLYFWRQKMERQSFRNKMISFSQEMDEIIKGAHSEMLKAKRIHEGVVPKRSEDIRGIQLTSKYAVGEGSGSEYFDIIRGQAYSHLVFLHTSSYLASSCLMGIFNKHKSSPTGLVESAFLEEAALELRMINVHKKNPVDVQMLLIRIDHTSLQCDGYSFGDFELFCRGNEAFKLPSVKNFDLAQADKARFNMTLSMGEKVIVFSPGFIFNWKEATPKRTRAQFIREQGNMSSVELLMELFFQLKKQSSGEFLAKDATTVMMEVNRHAIQQV